MVQELFRWLGSLRSGVLAALLVGVALLSLVLQIGYSGEDWVLQAQLGVIWLLFAGLALVLGSRLPESGRGRLILALGPGLLLVGLGIAFPSLALFFGGAGLGWMLTSQFVLRSRVRMEYQAAVRHLRQSEYAEATAVMDTLITAEGDVPEHYRFRAEIARLAGKLDRARADYERMIALDPESAAGYIGLSEVYAQQGDFGAAHPYAVDAVEREPRLWLAAYNLGMINDRLGQSGAALKYLEAAWAIGLPHDRYRLLARLWMARSAYRQGQADAAREHITWMQKHRGGIDDWLLVFESEQAAPLRRLLETDVLLAQQIVNGAASLDALG
ncbi:MAG: tetratricopeptide repeat protein [Anaerolineae bacterium]|nr:tetratricopeptide repeat protein [Anaerolineae bacterium]